MDSEITCYQVKTLNGSSKAYSMFSINHMLPWRGNGHDVESDLDRRFKANRLKLSWMR